MRLMVIIVLTLFTLGCSGPKLKPIMQGDCVDRAVQIRQDLKKQGYDAEIVLGVLNDEQGHAWIKYRKSDKEEWKVLENY